MKKIVNFSQKHWIASLLLVKLSSIWFSLILVFGGNYLKLTVIDDEGNCTLSLLGIILTCIIVFLSLFIVIVERYSETHSEINKIVAEKAILDKLNSSVNSICSKKVSRQLNVIKKIRNNEITAPFIYTSPCEQIGVIIDELTDCISFMVSEKYHQFKKDDFQIFLLYNLPLEDRNKWYVANNYSDNAFELEKIASKGSAFYDLINSEEQSVFINNKQRAFKEHKYVKDASDDVNLKNELKGSICYYKINIGNTTGTYIRAVIRIATHNKRIINEDKYKNPENNNGKFKRKLNEACQFLSDNIKYNLIDNYKHRMGVELCNYYIQYLAKQKQS